MFALVPLPTGAYVFIYNVTMGTLNLKPLVAGVDALVESTKQQFNNNACGTFILAHIYVDTWIFIAMNNS